jgi:hypothetical protein
MRDFTTAEQNAYLNRTILARDLVYFTAKDFSTGDDISFGFWNGIGAVALDVVDGITATTVSRNFSSKGAVLAVEDIPVSDKLDVTAVAVTLSQLNADVENALRGYDMRNAPIQIYRALFDTAAQRSLVAPARCRFAGFVNTCPITTPKIGGAAQAVLNCVGNVNELTRQNVDTRSDESQQRRASGDRFFQYVGVTGQIQVWWGQDKST